MVGQDRAGCVCLSVPLVYHILQQNICTTGTVETSLPQNLVHLWSVLWFSCNVVVSFPAHADDIQYVCQDDCGTASVDTSGKV